MVFSYLVHDITISFLLGSWYQFPAWFMVSEQKATPMSIAGQSVQAEIMVSTELTDEWRGLLPTIQMRNCYCLFPVTDQV